MSASDPERSFTSSELPAAANSATTGSQVRDALLSEHVRQEREDVAMCFLHGDFVVVDRHAPLETRIGRTERLFRLHIKDNATLAFGETASARR
jgi:hypothetical protein